MMSDVVIYNDGRFSIEISVDDDTLWMDAEQIASIFDVNRPAIVKHIGNIYKSAELDKESTCSILEQVAKDGKKRKKNYYNLDMVISVGYRVNSLKATKFRRWASKILKEHITKGYTINRDRLRKNYDEFLQVVEEIKLLSKNTQNVRVEDVLELIKSFSATWFGLDSYDREALPKEGINKVNLSYEVDKLYQDISTFKEELIKRGEATEIFATEKTPKSLEGIVGNVFQSVFGEDAYPSVEEKAAHLLYFIVKNHPFNDGNKRTGAFSFIWLLKRAGVDVAEYINPNALTALTLLIAESNPADKDRMVGLVLLMLRPDSA